MWGGGLSVAHDLFAIRIMYVSYSSYSIVALFMPSQMPVNFFQFLSDIANSVPKYTRSITVTHFSL